MKQHPEKPISTHPRRRSGGLSLESLVLLVFGLVVGSGLAGFVLIQAWLLLRDEDPATAGPGQVIVQAIPSGTLSPTIPPLPTYTPLPTIPVEMIAIPSIAGGSIATTTGAVRFTLVTGSTVIVGPETEIELTQLPSAGAATRDVILTILRGRLLVQAVLGPNDTFRVQTPSLDVAQVIGSIMGVEYDPVSQTIHVDCLEGHCRLGKSTDPQSDTVTEAVDLNGGQYTFQNPESTPAPLQESRNELWQPLGGDMVPPPNTPEPDPETDCAAFEAEFPTTPCP